MQTSNLPCPLSVTGPAEPAGEGWFGSVGFKEGMLFVSADCVELIGCTADFVAVGSVGVVVGLVDVGVVAIESAGSAGLVVVVGGWVGDSVDESGLFSGVVLRMLEVAAVASVNVPGTAYHERKYLVRLEWRGSACMPPTSKSTHTCVYITGILG